jgi:GNAT superfamily N-acetyltransferase
MTNSFFMQKISQDQLEPVARLLTECFIDEPVTAYQIQGIDNPQDFLLKLFKMQMGIYSQTKDVYQLDKCAAGVIIGSEKKKEKKFKQILAGIKASSRLRRDTDTDDYKIYTNNLKAILKEIDLNWQKKFITTNYYHLSIMAVDPQERGKGNAKKLILPIIDTYKEQNIPITLETANTDQIDLYKHLGFRLVKTISGEKTGINQYCFLMQNGS